MTDNVFISVGDVVIYKDKYKLVPYTKLLVETAYENEVFKVEGYLQNQ